MTILGQMEASLPTMTTSSGETFSTAIIPLPTGDPANAVSPIQPVQILSVAADSNHLRAAWEVVKFVACEQWAKQRGMTMNGYLLSRPAEQLDVKGRGLEAFYQGAEEFRPHTESQLPVSFTQPFELKLVELLQQAARPADRC